MDTFSYRFDFIVRCFDFFLCDGFVSLRVFSDKSTGQKFENGSEQVKPIEVHFYEKLELRMKMIPHAFRNSVCAL